MCVNESKFGKHFWYPYCREKCYISLDHLPMYHFWWHESLWNESDLPMWHLPKLKSKTWDWDDLDLCRGGIVDIIGQRMLKMELPGRKRGRPQWGFIDVAKEDMKGVVLFVLYFEATCWSGTTQLQERLRPLLVCCHIFFPSIIICIMETNIIYLYIGNVFTLKRIVMMLKTFILKLSWIVVKL